MINKQGATYGSWIEVILFIVLFVGILAIISTSMNSAYSKSNDLTFGIVTSDTLQNVKDLSGSFSNSTQVEGQMSMTSYGLLILSTIPKMITAVMSLVWTFISGGFINSIVGAMNLGDYAGLVIIIFKLLYFISLGLILLKIITKVVI